MARLPEDCKYPGLKESGDRFNEGKPQLSYLLDVPLAMEGLVNRFMFGAKKYGRNNWKKGLKQRELIDSLMRHLKKYVNGQLLDPEFGDAHLDAVLWNAAILSEQHHKGIKLD